MTASQSIVNQDYIIEALKQKFGCRVLWCEGRACLEYNRIEDLDLWADYVKSSFGTDLMDVFFTAVESLPADS